MDTPIRHIGRVGIPVSAANETQANPCLDCGACCAHFRVSFYCGELAGEHGGWVPVDWVTQLTPLRACMKGTEMGHARCQALRASVGLAALPRRPQHNPDEPPQDPDNPLAA